MIDKKDWKAEHEKKLEEASKMIMEIGEFYCTSPELIAEHLEFAARFYKYSFRNTALIKMQNPNSVYVQSFAAWKKMGVTVLKGKHGMKILTPVMVTYLKVPLQDLTPEQLAWAQENIDISRTDYIHIQLMYASQKQKYKYKANLYESTKKMNYKIGTVFDIAQTDYPKEDYPKLFSMGYSSDQHKYIVEGLIDYYKSMGHMVKYDDDYGLLLRGTFNSASKDIKLNLLLEDTAQLSTLTHELGHYLFEHGSKNQNKTTDQKELEADCISIILQSFYGLELLESRKKHLADHYKAFENELIKDGPKKEDIFEKMEEILSSAQKIFKENIDSIDMYVRLAIFRHTATPEEKMFKMLPEASVTYEVIEHVDAAEMGEVYNSINSPEEAIKIYNKLKDDPNMNPGIDVAITLDVDGDFKKCIPIMRNDRIDIKEAYFEETDFAAQAIDKIADLVTYVSDNTSYHVDNNFSLKLKSLA